MRTEEKNEVFYIANDGKKFANESDCIAYEKELDFKKFISDKRISYCHLPNELIYMMFGYGYQDISDSIVVYDESKASIERYFELRLIENNILKNDMELIFQWKREYTVNHEEPVFIFFYKLKTVDEKLTVKVVHYTRSEMNRWRDIATRKWRHKFNKWLSFDIDNMNKEVKSRGLK